MLPPYDRYDRGSSRRAVWTHWVPLAVTLTAATVGLAAWVWSQRRDDEDDSNETDLVYDAADYGENPPYSIAGQGGDPGSAPRQRDGDNYGAASAPSQVSGAGWGARMSGALWRAPSPQQFLDSTGKTVAAGVAAAGAVVGKALASIREEDKTYSENPWSEEADAKRDRAPQAQGNQRRRKSIAVIVSADAQITRGDDDGSHELAVGQRSAVKELIRR